MVVDDPLEKQLDRAVNTRSNVDSTCWTVFSVFAAANVVLIDALVQVQTVIGARWVALAGVGVSAIWAALQRRALAHLRLHEEIIDALELKLEIPGEFSPTWRNTGGHERIRAACPFRARDVMNNGTLLALTAWLITLTWNLMFRAR